MDAETKRTCLTKDPAKPHYGYYALPLLTILSAILIVTGIICLDRPKYGARDSEV